MSRRQRKFRVKLRKRNLRHRGRRRNHYRGSGNGDAGEVMAHPAMNEILCGRAAYMGEDMGRHDEQSRRHQAERGPRQPLAHLVNYIKPAAGHPKGVFPRLSRVPPPSELRQPRAGTCGNSCPSRRLPVVEQLQAEHVDGVGVACGVNRGEDGRAGRGPIFFAAARFSGLAGRGNGRRTSGRGPAPECR